jgi:uncharacterized protein YlaI
MKMVYQVVCSWCGKHLGEKECPGSKVKDRPITHSICEGCKAKVMAEIEQLKKGDARCAMIS